MHFKPCFWLCQMVSKTWKVSFIENVNSLWRFFPYKEWFTCPLGYGLCTIQHVSVLVPHIWDTDPRQAAVPWYGGFFMMNGNPLQAAFIFSSESLNTLGVARVFWTFISITNAFKLTTRQISFPWASRKIKRKDRNCYVTDYLLLHSP